MGYLIVVAGALATEFLEHTRWLSVVVGLLTAIVTSLLGTTKTVLEIVDKGLDISRKTPDLEMVAGQSKIGGLVEPTMLLSKQAVLTMIVRSPANQISHLGMSHVWTF